MMFPPKCLCFISVHLVEVLKLGRGVAHIRLLLSRLPRYVAPRTRATLPHKRRGLGSTKLVEEPNKCDLPFSPEVEVLSP